MDKRILSTANGLSSQNQKFIIVTKKIIKVPSKYSLNLISINKRLRGELELSPCTCSVNHGFH